ncbi:MAG TPA: tetratricopeptide repeat protein [Candidatus Obscuribacterales bacterium]
MLRDFSEIVSMIGMAQAEMRSGNSGQAISLYTSALGNLTPDDGLAVLCLQGLGEVYRHTNELDKAAHYLNLLCQIEERTLGEGHPDVVETKRQLAELYQALGRQSEAESMRQDVSNHYAKLEAYKRSDMPVPQRSEQSHGIDEPLSYPAGNNGFGSPLTPSGLASGLSAKKSQANAADTDRDDEENTPYADESLKKLRREKDKPPQAVALFDSINDGFSKLVFRLFDLIKGRKKIDRKAKKEKSPVPLMSAAAGILMVGGCLLVLLHSAETADKSSIGSISCPQFMSADERATFARLPNGRGQLRLNNAACEVPVEHLHGGTGDVKQLATGCLTRKEYWLQSTDYGLRSVDGQMFYSLKAPESLVFAHMRRLERAIQAYYAMNNAYPTSANELPSTAVRYQNPFTQRLDQVFFQVVDLNKTKSMSGIPLSVLKQMAFAGLPWPGEPQFYPGCINCLVISGGSDKQGPQQIIIRGCDRRARQFSSAIPGNHFAIVLDTGLSDVMSSSSAQLTLDGKLPYSVVCIATGALTALPLEALAYRGAFLFSGLALFLGMIFLCMDRDGSGHIIVAMLSLGALGLAGMAVMRQFM